MVAKEGGPSAATAATAANGEGKGPRVPPDTPTRGAPGTAVEVAVGVAVAAAADPCGCAIQKLLLLLLPVVPVSTADAPLLAWPVAEGGRGARGGSGAA